MEDDKEGEKKQFEEKLRRGGLDEDIIRIMLKTFDIQKGKKGEMIETMIAGKDEEREDDDSQEEERMAGDKERGRKQQEEKLIDNTLSRGMRTQPDVNVTRTQPEIMLGMDGQQT